MSPGEIEDWALGCSAILATANGSIPHYFGMFDSNPKNKQTAISVLSQSWNCNSRSDLIQLVERMTDNGHSARFVEMLNSPNGADRTQAALAKTLSEKWGEKQIKAWDWFRMIHVTGWGYHAGYIELEEAYDLMLPVIERLFHTFSSWEEASDNYLDGYAWWAKIDIQSPVSEYKKRVAIFEDLKSDFVLYDPYLWLSAEADKPTGYTDGYKYLAIKDNSCTIIRYWGPQEGDLTIPGTLDGHTVTLIGSRAFIGCDGFTGTLTLPKTLVGIGYQAFSFCKGFTGDLIIPEKVVLIDTEAFFQSSGFDGSLVLPKGLTTINVSAFNGCWGLSGSLELPESLAALGTNAFANCISITDVVVPAGITELGGGAFYGCTSLERAEFKGNAPKLLGERVFSSCAQDFQIVYDPSTSGWSTPEWMKYPAFPK
ncbi:MAG: leucine-rich repeat protein [Coriobacteriia bacterium]|nr:leucine-rich repeat protein [Coriobacteriia bacterium]